MFTILRHRGFRDLWLGQAISQLGDSLYFIVFMFLAKKATGSDAFVGFVGAAETLPFLLVGPYAGVLVDRIDRRIILILSDVISAIVLLFFLVLVIVGGDPPAWALLLVPFLLSSVRCFFWPAKSAAIPALVPPAELQAANGLSAFTGTFAQMGGLALSAGVVALLFDFAPTQFIALSVALNLFSFSLSGYFCWRLPKLVPERDTAPAHPMEDLKEGFRFVRSRRDLVTTIALITCLRAFIAPFFVCYVAVNERWFDGKPATLAWLEFSFFLGMAITAPLASKLRVRRPAQWFAWSLVVVGLGVGSFAIAKNFWLFFGLNLVAGLAVPLGDVPINTYITRSVADGFRGRVSSVTNMVATGVMPIGAVLGGTLVARFGVEWVFVGMGAGFVIPALIALADPRYRRLRMPDEDHPGEPEERPERRELTHAVAPITSERDGG